MLTRDSFRANARDISASIAGVQVAISPKCFKTGSLGWHSNGKITITLSSGERVECQMGLSLTVVDSKELPQ